MFSGKKLKLELEKLGSDDKVRSHEEPESISTSGVKAGLGESHVNTVRSLVPVRYPSTTRPHSECNPQCAVC